MVMRPITAVAAYTGRKRTLLHTWIKTGLLTAACDTHTRETLVDFGQAARLSQQKPRRAPRSLTRQAA